MKLINRDVFGLVLYTKEEKGNLVNHDFIFIFYFLFDSIRSVVPPRFETLVY